MAQRDLIEDARHTLRSHLGASVTLVERPGGAETIFHLSFVRGASYDVCVEVKRRVRAAMIPQLRERLADWMRDGAFSAGLLATRYVSEPLAQRLRDAGVCFADSVGNAYLEIPGTILVSSVGHRPPPEESSHANWLTVQGAKVLFHLLSRGPQVRSTYREMNRRLGVSLGMTSKVIVELLAHGILERQGRGAYDIVEPGRLLEMWADAYAARLRQRTLVARFSAPFGRDFGQIFRRSSLLNPLSSATIGGEYGAVLMMDPADAAHVSLYVPATETVAVRGLLGLVLEEEGELELHEAFADPLGRVRIKGEPRVADPVLVYAELMARNDPRSGELAARLRARHLAWTT